MAKKTAPRGVEPRQLRRLRHAIPTLHDWYRRSARDLPWRRTREPYAIWVSEVMLQQTQVATVLPYYDAWLVDFPDVAALARADEQDVLRRWEGLGYYSRARNLHRAAQVVAAELPGAVPSDPRRFRALPGVGPYTCAAVMSIAFGQDLAAVDGNVKRVLARLVRLEHDAGRSPGSRILDELAVALLPAGRAALHNQAMMELGALVCTPRAPRCGDCPLGKVCLARQAGAPEAYPRRARRVKLPHRHFAVALLTTADGVLVDRRPPGGLLGGLWEFPRFELARDGEPGPAVVSGMHRGFGQSVKVTAQLPEVRHAYSHFRVTLLPCVCSAGPPRALRAAEGQPVRWIAADRLEEVPMSTADRKVMRALWQSLVKEPA